MTLLKCPVCDTPFDPAQSKAMPFCSERCRTIDLGRWLSEGYAVPDETPREEREEAEREN